ncbi:Uncharacterised protein [Bordetella pertussis]|nr:Uncharacterised protein [Bordetella pertussis]
MSRWMPAGASAADSARNAASQSTWPGVLAWAIFMSVTPVPANWFSACTQ